MIDMCGSFDLSIRFESNPFNANPEYLSFEASSKLETRPGYLRYVVFRNILPRHSARGSKVIWPSMALLVYVPYAECRVWRLELWGSQDTPQPDNSTRVLFQF